MLSRKGPPIPDVNLRGQSENNSNPDLMLLQPCVRHVGQPQIAALELEVEVVLGNLPLEKAVNMEWSNVSMHREETKVKLWPVFAQWSAARSRSRDQ